ncbi:hypothetical protein ACVXG7_01150 [Enterobacter hormaechei]
MNTISIYYTLSSTHTTADKKYFTNTVESSGGVTAAGGVGVMIWIARTIIILCQRMAASTSSRWVKCTAIP